MVKFNSHRIRLFSKINIFVAQLPGKVHLANASSLTVKGRKIEKKDQREIGIGEKQARFEPGPPPQHFNHYPPFAATTASHHLILVDKKSSYLKCLKRSSKRMLLFYHSFLVLAWAGGAQSVEKDLLPVHLPSALHCMLSNSTAHEMSEST